jgi:hypothetical protein
MFTSKIDASDLKKIEALLSGPLGMEIAQAVADEAVIPELAKEPFRAPGKKMIFTSSKQRAFVIAAIRSGDIRIPYVRTGQIGITEKHATANGVDVVVPAPYSDLVRTKGLQAKYHEGTWPTTEDIARDIESDEAELIALAYLLDALEKAGLT